MKKPKLGAASVEYVFLDVVGYSKRLIESQTSIIETLNLIVEDSVRTHQLGPDHVIYVPTGDGICAALLNVGDPYDIQMQIALAILEHLQEHNARTADEQLKFKVRIGINANRDNVVVDINGRPNVAGAGINECSRIMDKADGGQILVGDPVFKLLKQRKKYASAFRGPYTPLVKHGFPLPMHQFVADGYPFLNVEVPTAFQATDIKGQQGPRFSNAKAVLQRGGLKIRVEIGPVRSGETAQVDPKRKLIVSALVDTGASRTVINPEVAATCGLRQTGMVRISTTGMVTEAAEYAGAIRFPHLNLKGIEPVTLVACPLPEQDVSCLLGRDVLQRWRLVYDGRTGEAEIDE